MATKNDITGDEIRSRVTTDKYRDAYDKIDWGGTKDYHDKTLDKQTPEEQWKDSMKRGK